ncbi:MAG: YqgE/AlgH family protein, partial [Planctomycetota bacterium]
RLAPVVPGAVPVVDDVHFGGDPAAIRSLLDEQQAGVDRVRFVLGYSGWGKGQLERELIEGSWVVCRADGDLAFDPEPETVWRRALKAMGGPFALLANEPPDPSWN